MKKACGNVRTTDSLGSIILSDDFGSDLYVTHQTANFAREKLSDIGRSMGR